MQENEEIRENSDEAYRMIGHVVLTLADQGLETKRLRIAEVFREELNIPGKWSPGMREVISIVIRKLEILPDVGDAESF